MVVADSDVAAVGSVNPSEDEDGKAEVGVSTGRELEVGVSTGCELEVCVWTGCELEVGLPSGGVTEVCVRVHGSGIKRE